MTMTIFFLVNAPGHVTNEGSVELDLAGNGATEFLFTGVDTRFEEGKLGAHLLEWFKTLEDSQKNSRWVSCARTPRTLYNLGIFEF